MNLKYDCLCNKNFQFNCVLCILNVIIKLVFSSHTSNFRYQRPPLTPP